MRVRAGDTRGAGVVRGPHAQNRLGEDGDLELFPADNTNAQAVLSGTDSLHNIGSDSLRWLLAYLDACNVRAGTGTATGRVPCVLDYGGSVNGGTDPTPVDVVGYTIPANTMDADGASIDLVAWGSIGATAGNKTFDYDVDGSTVINRVVTLTSASWALTSTIVRTGASAGEIYARLSIETTGGGSPESYTQRRVLSSTDWTAAVEIDLNLMAATAGTNITKTAHLLRYWPAPT